VSPRRRPGSPPFCPNPACRFHTDPRGWRPRRKGFFVREARPNRIQRYQCPHCRRCFSSQTFSPTYWLKRPDLPRALFGRLVACSAYRQIARDLGVSPTTVLRQTERLGRHCLLFHERLRPKQAPLEPLAVDGFESFEASQYAPCHFHLAAGCRSHFLYAFTDSELRRKGRMTEAQRERRAERERRLGRPDPKSIEREMAELVALVVPPGASARIRSDEHPAYPRAWRRLSDRALVHETVSSKAARTPANPLFAVNLTDLLIRHSSANHKRETIAFSKRRQSAAERLAIFQVWRNYLKSFSERKRDATPAQRLGITAKKLTVDDVLAKRLFPSRVGLPERLARYYWRLTPTRGLAHPRTHRLRFAA
jgi:transposase-like protein